ncbi:hypothetical protein [Agriterribacter sp.]|uniref:hypothetical protein n=1 Tax=Agriterribacter sp. TaxID=2821509 RepID=UPI002C091A5F|nr:hypothetical protein [Agriterribacter sp.]HRO48205.1 hypothetical protein [Agriterribacter sp.]HRQ18653.1 hypothetical protein [Agriterribacter sp.]
MKHETPANRSAPGFHSCPTTACDENPGANYKDDALQKAKLYFIQQGNREKLLPYFWANMVLMGNAEPVTFSHSAGVPWWLIIFVPVLSGAFYIVIRKRKKLL